MYEVNDIIEKLKKTEQLAVFGAGNIAYTVVHCLRRDPYRLSIQYCLVSDAKGNPGQVDGVPVIDLDAAEALPKDIMILIATMERYLEAILENLHRHGYRNIIPVTFDSDLWERIREGYFKENGIWRHKQYLTLEGELWRQPPHTEEALSEIHVYTAKCHADRALQEDVSRFSWEIPIQVGANLTEKRICQVCDNTGEHISEKNLTYCELTALYWIWKNDRSKYAGLCHYRRHFELDRSLLAKLAESDIDVVLTIPIFNFPSVRERYRGDHMIEDWDVMLEAVRLLDPEYMETIKELQDGNYYYAYNMLIARREILDAYCSWLFPILSYCEKHCKEKQDAYQNRYIGFLAERLMSAYFLHHENEYKIVHAGKHFIER